MKALVIGGSGSIGSAIVEQLLSDGYEVIVHYNQSSP
ncbi:NAD-dependent epimerase/dehydratase family protein, partial [Klebsiella pneumoniae]|nr:NAD-dependent epimerase/dehydratase family protein [Klebsiella pneumoniae]